MEKDPRTASVILAAGRGSRMKGFGGNKTLLPLVPKTSSFDGDHPILLEILQGLPPGPKAVVVNYKKEDVIEATRGLGLTYCEQSELNGTGGALLAAREFLEKQDCSSVLITMGDVPFVGKETNRALIARLEDKGVVVLGFRPESKKQYGVLKLEGDRVRKIIEWRYWSAYTEAVKETLDICNSGICAARRDEVLRYIPVLASRPHSIQKEIGGKLVEVEEFFLTDLMEYMDEGGVEIGYEVAEEIQVMGIDDLDALKKAQDIFRSRAMPQGRDIRA
ncbi:MAG: NTP transferase domain-containing protein [Desulfobacteraceae bacterium]|nr:NTP transferase domain-containing protein [Desulfobacteraceae bacterium]